MSAAACESDVCSTRIYPKDVVASVRKVMKTVNLSSEDPVDVPSYMVPDETLRAANLRDATMVELQFDDHSVAEVDVLRSREMIKRHSGKYGSLCFVVRRPG